MLSYIALSKLITQHHPAVGALEFAAKTSQILTQNYFYINNLISGGLMVLRDYQRNRDLCEYAGLLVFELSKNMNKALDGEKMTKASVLGQLR